MAKKDKPKSSKRERRERRFLPKSETKPRNVKLLGGSAAVILGVGAWAEFGRMLMGVQAEPYPFAPWMLAVGALLFGAAVWMGSSGEPAVRVGASGIAVERGDLRRMPWHSVGRVTWDSDRESVTVKGKDEGARDWTFSLGVISHPQAVAHLLKEARDRIPAKVDVPDEVKGVPKPGPSDGQVILLDPVQVVGKRCVETRELILYEPDARVCPRCERIYEKRHVPATCACGADLSALRPGAGAPEAAGGSGSAEEA